jgi:hypothetical protein
MTDRSSVDRTAAVSSPGSILEVIRSFLAHVGSSNPVPCARGDGPQVAALFLPIVLALVAGFQDNVVSAGRSAGASQV